ncbi:hypothetical protein AK830_g1768 [Neonectria ditissima]|uniref:Uncharacterized protein n=1 Tax=Neonectria ditissima TaxID=78410 RepID=A0A0P7BTK3_9HYPO|nr:hypothetical protein AK830_g1768 [Neonectria ditissima]
MDEIYQQIANFNPRKFSHSPDVLFFEVTELWRSDATGAVKAFDSTIQVPAVATWLAEESRSTKSGTESLVLRLVWTDLDFDKKTVGLPKPAMASILDKFGLELAYNYSLSCITGINAFPPAIIAPSIKQETHAFCYAPKLASVWSHTRFQDPAKPCQSATCGIVLAKEKQKKVLKALLHSKWQPNFSTHAMFPAFLYSFMLSAEIEMALEGMKRRIQEVETRTGYASFETKRKRAASGELGVLSAEMSGFATRLASAERKSMALEKLMAFILERSDRKEATEIFTAAATGTKGATVTTPSTPEPPGTVPDGDSLMRNHTTVLQQRLDMQVLDKTYTLKRVQVQIEALVNLIGQHDSINNTDIALSSHRDASSMKTLAVVTMFFLPGSFIAALFSTPCFDWDSVNMSDESSIGVASTPQFNLYWAITIPMTIVTFILYFAWLQFQAYQRRKPHEDPGDEQLSTEPENEQELVEAKLVAKRRFSKFSLG